MVHTVHTVTQETAGDTSLQESPEGQPTTANYGYNTKEEEG
jgi:hypothetical protein